MEKEGIATEITLAIPTATVILVLGIMVTIIVMVLRIIVITILVVIIVIIIIVLFVDQKKPNEEGYIKASKIHELLKIDPMYIYDPINDKKEEYCNRFVCLQK